MMFRRRRKERSWRWLLAGFAPLVAWAVWVIREAVQRRQRWQPERRSAYPAAPRVYGMQAPPGTAEVDFRAATGDMGEELAETPLVGEAAKMPEPARTAAARASSEAAIYGQVPVTARKHPPARTGGARQYEAAAGPRARDNTTSERRPFPWLVALSLLAILSVVTVMGLLGRQSARAQVMTVPGGNPETGRQAIQAWGCGSCHTIPGVAGAQGKVGPRLEGLSERTYIAGILSNTPENMVEWIMNPQDIQPGNAMPDTDVPPPTARDMAAYLYTIP